jgi:hypothetical protein
MENPNRVSAAESHPLTSLRAGSLPGVPILDFASFAKFRVGCLLPPNLQPAVTTLIERK